MNNTIVLNQRVLARWKGEIDPTDAIIVSHIERVETSKNPKIIAKRIAAGHSWIDLETLLADNPVISMTYEGLRRRLSRLVKAGVLDRVCQKSSDNRNRSYFKLSDEWHEWVTYWQEHDSESVARVYGWAEDPRDEHTAVPPSRGIPVTRTAVPPSRGPRYPGTANPKVYPTVDQKGSDPPRLPLNPDKSKQPQSTLTATTDEIIDYLNERAGKQFRHSQSSRKPIRSRLAEGFTADDCRRVIDVKTAEWLGRTTQDGKQCADWLCPQTLFRPANFEKYLNQSSGSHPGADSQPDRFDALMEQACREAAS
jgi:uncharacterized phage protein (TIGR02220 family)